MARLNEVDPELQQATLLEIGEWYEGSEDPDPPWLGNIWLGLYDSWLRPRLTGGSAEEATRLAFFAVVEELAETGDEHVVGWVEYDICEPLRYDEPAAETAVPLMGPKTKAIYLSGSSS